MTHVSQRPGPVPPDLATSPGTCPSGEASSEPGGAAAVLGMSGDDCHTSLEEKNL